MTDFITDKMVEAALAAWLRDTGEHGEAWPQDYHQTFQNKFRADMRLALAAALRAAWRPIEEAKKDGKEILVYREDAGVFMAHYVEEDAHLSSQMNPPEGDCYWFSTTGEDLTSDMPTHFSPLLPGPEETI